MTAEIRVLRCEYRVNLKSLGALKVFDLSLATICRVELQLQTPRGQQLQRTHYLIRRLRGISSLIWRATRSCASIFTRAWRANRRLLNRKRASPGCLHHQIPLVRHSYQHSNSLSVAIPWHKVGFDLTRVGNKHARAGYIISICARTHRLDWWLGDGNT